MKKMRLILNIALARLGWRAPDVLEYVKSNMEC